MTQHVSLEPTQSKQKRRKKTFDSIKYSFQYSFNYALNYSYHYSFKSFYNS